MTNQISPELMHERFTMNPETDDLIRGGSLKPGMVVLLEDSTFRVKFNEFTDLSRLSTYEYKKLMAGQRWCEVTEIEKRGDLISFIGVYADGTKATRTYHRSYGWYVKKDSIPES